VDVHQRAPAAGKKSKAKNGKKEQQKINNLQEGQMNTLVSSNESLETTKEEIPEKIWFQLDEFVRNDNETQQTIRFKKGYITGLEYEDLNREALIAAIETYQKCTEFFRCLKCDATGATSCGIFKITYIARLKETLYKLQNLKKRNGIISYTEVECDEYEYPTHCRKNWNKTINAENTPLTELIEEEEQIDREKIRRENAEKILYALSKMKKKEREVWKLYLAGVDVKEIAIKLGYNKIQGVYMTLRRSLYRVKARI